MTTTTVTDLTPKQMREAIEAAALAYRIRYVNAGLGNPAGDPDPATFNEETRTRLLPGMHHYAPTLGMPQAIQAVRTFMEEVEGVSLSENEVVIAPAATRRLPEQLAHNLRNELGRPPEFVLRKPGYGGHSEVIEAAGGICKYVEYQYGKERYIDVLEEQVLSGKVSGDVFIHLTVDNPTTEQMSFQEMERAVLISEVSNGAITWFDGAYHHVTRKGFMTPNPLRVEGALNRKVVMTLSASKVFRYPGLGTGALVGDNVVRDRVASINGKETEGGRKSAQLAFAAGLLACVNDPENGGIIGSRKINTPIADTMQRLFLEAGWGVGDWTASNFRYPRIPEAWLDDGRNSFDFSMALAECGIVTYPDKMFQGEGTDVRVLLTGSDDDLTYFAEVVYGLVQHYA